LSYRAAVSSSRLAIAAVLALSCLSNAISDGVSIRSACEVAGFGLGERFEAEAESLAPPVFESAMFVSQFAKLFVRQREGISSMPPLAWARMLATSCAGYRRAQFGQDSL
jgi:hypothetical protein